MMSIILETKLSDKDIMVIAVFIGKVNRVVEAAKPFTLDSIVDETSGTILLMDELRSAIIDIGA